MVAIYTLLALLVTITVFEGLRLYFIIKKNKNAQADLDKRQNEIAYLSFLTQAAVEDKESITEFFPKVLDRLKEMVGWMAHSLWRLDEEQQVLPIRFTGYLPDWYMRTLSVEMQVRVGDGSVGRAVQLKQPVIINKARSSDPRFARFTHLAINTGYKCLSGHPVVGRLRTHGALCSYGIEENMFQLHDAQFLLICSYLYGAILENKLLEDYLNGKSNQSPA